VFVNHLCEAKGEQDGEANKAQERMAEFGMTKVRIGLFQHALAHDWTGIPGIIQYRRISPPDPQVFTGLDLSAIDYCI
jgi:hypothetical protein